jgi:hypothetical protein
MCKPVDLLGGETVEQAVTAGGAWEQPRDVWAAFQERANAI